MVGQWLTACKYTLYAPEMISAAYKKVAPSPGNFQIHAYLAPQSQSKPFAIPSIKRYIVFVSAKHQIEEVWDAPPEDVSSNAALVDVRAAIPLDGLVDCGNWNLLSPYFRSISSMDSSSVLGIIEIAYQSMQSRHHSSSNCLHYFRY